MSLLLLINQKAKILFWNFTNILKNYDCCLTRLPGLGHGDGGERALAVGVDGLHHHLVLGVLLQPPHQELEPRHLPLVTVQVEKLERCFEAKSKIISGTSLSFLVEISLGRPFIFQPLSKEIVSSLKKCLALKFEVFISHLPPRPDKVRTIITRTPCIRGCI